MKIIKELQEAVKSLQAIQHTLISHIESLEDTVIALSDKEDDSEEFKTAKRVARKIKRKRHEKSKKLNEDSNTSNESQMYRKPLRFKRTTVSNKPRYWTIEQESEHIDNNQNKEMEVEEERKDE